MFNAVILHFQEDYENPKDERGDMQNVLVGVSKKVYKQMVKEIDIIALQVEPSQQQRASIV